nr:MAG TPA: hypothetical protein [Caudoviricetes sp.]
MAVRKICFSGAFCANFANYAGILRTVSYTIRVMY